VHSIPRICCGLGGGGFNDWLAYEFVDSAAGSVLHGNIDARRIVSFRPKWPNLVYGCLYSYLINSNNRKSFQVKVYASGAPNHC
jgi:hypothetical protein